LRTNSKSAAWAFGHQDSLGGVDPSLNQMAASNMNLDAATQARFSGGVWMFSSLCIIVMFPLSVFLDCYLPSQHVSVEGFHAKQGSEGCEVKYITIGLVMQFFPRPYKHKHSS
jgi:hypothetical protein